MKELLTGKVKIICIVVLCCLVVCGCSYTLWSNHQQEQLQAQLEQEEKVRIAEEEKVLEQIKINEFNTTKTEVVLLLDEQTETWQDWFTEEDLVYIKELRERIMSATIEENLNGFVIEIEELAANAEAAKIAAEEAQKQSYYTYNNNYNYDYSSELSSGDAKEQIAWYESRGSYDATNGQYWGRYQLSNGWFDGYDKDFILNTEEGHAIQEEKANEYVEGRYGSWENAHNFWQNNGWY